MGTGPMVLSGTLPGWAEYFSGASGGEGYGYGSCSGIALGSGYGKGSGSGAGAGYCFSYGSGDGYGSSSDFASGYGEGYGSGAGAGYGYGCGYGSGSGYGYGYGSGSGFGSGSGSGDGSGYWMSALEGIIQHLTIKDEAFLAFWRPSADGSPANYGTGKPVAIGDRQEISGPLKLCGEGALHATLQPGKWEGKRLWIVALEGKLAFENDQVGALKREILAEVKQC